MFYVSCYPSVGRLGDIARGRRVPFSGMHGVMGMRAGVGRVSERMNGTGLDIISLLWSFYFGHEHGGFRIGISVLSFFFGYWVSIVMGLSAHRAWGFLFLLGEGGIKRFQQQHGRRRRRH